MKKADYMIVGIALMLALVSFGVYRLYFASTGRAAIVEITVDGNVYKTLSLKEDATVDVPSDGGHTNTVQIKDGKVFMKKADCPDKICVHHKGIRSNGETLSFSAATVKPNKFSLIVSPFRKDRRSALSAALLLRPDKSCIRRRDGHR